MALNIMEKQSSNWCTEFVLLAWKERRFISILMAVFLSVGIISCFLVPKQYTAIATLLPPQVSDSSVEGLLSNIEGAAGILSETGDTLPKLYPEIAKSRTILNGLLNATFNNESFRKILQRKYKFRKNINDRLIYKLQKKIIDVTISSKTNIVTISSTYSDPEISAAIVNEIVNQIGYFFKFHYKSIATSQRLEIEKRLYEVADSLKTSEESLLLFKERNRITLLSPTLQLHEARLSREVEIHNALYIELTRQLELLKISELQLRPVLNVLDQAVPPFKKSKPSHLKILYVCMLTGIVNTGFYLKYIQLSQH